MEQHNIKTLARLIKKERKVAKRLRRALQTFDLKTVVGPQLKGVMVPTVRSFDELVAGGDLLGRLESAADLPLGGLKLLPIVETARGLLAVNDLAGAPRPSTDDRGGRSRCRTGGRSGQRGRFRPAPPPPSPPFPFLF